MKRKISLKEIFENVLIATITIIISYVLIFVGVTQYDNYVSLNTYTKNFKNVQYIYLSHKYGTPEEKNIFEVTKTKSYIDKFKSLYNDIINNDSFIYIELNNQQIYTYGHYTGDLKFVYGYEGGHAEENLNINSYDGETTPFSTMQIGKKAMEYYNMADYISDGNTYTDEDYDFDGTKEIPVILGYDYNEIYKIGDSFETTYLDTAVKFKVQGFFRKGTTIPFRGWLFSLDTYIMMPSINITNEAKIYTKQESFVGMVYLYKLSGAIPYSSVDEGNSFKEELSKIIEKYDLPFLTSPAFGEIDGNKINAYSLVNSKIIQLSIVYLILVLILLFIIFKGKLNRNMKQYSIRLFNGMTMFNLRITIFSSIIVILLLSCIIGITLFYFLNYKMYDVEIINDVIGWVFFLHMIVAIFIYIIFNFYLNRVNIYKAIRRE